MKTVVTLGELTATIENGQVKSENDWFRYAIMLLPLPNAYLPDPDRALAEVAVQKLQVEVVSYDGPPVVAKGSIA